MQEVWKVSTTAGLKRVKKGSSVHEASTSGGLSVRETEVPDHLLVCFVALSISVTGSGSSLL